MMTSFLAACVQTNTTDDVSRNLEQIEALISDAKADGADLIALPEACDFLSPDLSATRGYAKLPGEHRALATIREIAVAKGCHLLVGSLTVKSEDGTLANRSFVLSPTGEILAQYDKIHMFDANVEGAEGAKESDIYKPGKKAQAVKLPWGQLGLSICYDLRFPHLYRGLAMRGASMLAVPSAFMSETGKAHWSSLLRARAIENTCFVLAPAQTGHHYDNRYSHGHSLIISPWGEVLADAGTEVGVAMAEINMDMVHVARSKISSLEHDRDFGWAEPSVVAT